MAPRGEDRSKVARIRNGTAACARRIVFAPLGRASRTDWRPIAAPPQAIDIRAYLKPITMLQNIPKPKDRNGLPHIVEASSREFLGHVRDNEIGEFYMALPTAPFAGKPPRL